MASIKEKEVVERLFNAFAAPLCRAAGALVPDGLQHQVEDVVQETFAAFYLAIPRIKCLHVKDTSSAEVERQCRAYLRTILKRKCFQLREREARAPQPFASGEDADDQEAPADDDEQADQLLRCLRDLPGSDGEIVSMYYFENCDYKTIAGRMGIPRGTVASRLHRAKTKLKELLSRNPP